jgi:hypothetical protein
MFPGHRVSPCEKRTSYVPWLHLLLTARADRVTIDILPNDVLLYIFHFDRLEDADYLWHMKWRRLIHVCQMWRSVAFASPKFFELRIVCGPRTRMELIGIWPPLPIVIGNGEDGSTPEVDDFDGIDAAIVHHNRICKIDLHLTSSKLHRLASVMQEQFPTLTYLKLVSDYSVPRALLPDGFLGGYAPRLQSLKFEGIVFPVPLKFLLSATNLIHLTLWRTYHPGCITPDTLVTILAVLTNLKSLTIGSGPILSSIDQESRYSPPLNRTVLPALIHFELRGASNYVESFMAQIDTPLLDSLCITFFHPDTFDMPQLAQFMRRTTRFQALNEAHVDLNSHGILVESPPQMWTFDPLSGLRIVYEDYMWQLSSVAQVLTSLIPSIYVVEHLYICGCEDLVSRWRDDIEITQWREIFHPFNSVKNLYVNKALAQRIAPTLQELVGENVTAALPALETLFLENLHELEPFRDIIEQSVAARRLLGHHIAVSDWSTS